MNEENDEIRYFLLKNLQVLKIVNNSKVYVQDMNGEWVHDQRYIHVFFGGIIDFYEISEEYARQIGEYKAEVQKKRNSNQ